jgi:hypothetical protein
MSIEHMPASNPGEEQKPQPFQDGLLNRNYGRDVKAWEAKQGETPIPTETSAATERKPQAQPEGEGTEPGSDQENTVGRAPRTDSKAEEAQQGPDMGAIYTEVFRDQNDGRPLMARLIERLTKQSVGNPEREALELIQSRVDPSFDVSQRNDAVLSEVRKYRDWREAQPK